jgi:hypothetical protein
MFSLATVDAGAAGSVAPNETGICVREWISTSGAVQARAFVGGGWNWIVWDGVATYRFRRHSGTVEAFPAEGAHPFTVKDLYRRHILPVVMQANGSEVIHASAVATDRGILAFCGDCGSGKSTVAYALGRRGFPLFADDAVIVEAGQGRVEALSIPFRPRLRPASARFFGCDSPRLKTEDPQYETGRRALAALFVLESPAHDQSLPEIRQIRSLEAFRLLLWHARRFDPTDRAGRKRYLENYLEIAAIVPVFSVRFARGFERLDALLDGMLRAGGVESHELCSRT